MNKEQAEQAKEANKARALANLAAKGVDQETRV